MERSIRVLIVEDNALTSDVIQHVLRKAGYTVIGEASDGHEAVELAAELRPDVVLMDVMMPEMDGIEAARQIQKVYPVPIVMLTAHDTLDLVAEASQAGVGAYLVKPPHAGEIERAIMVAQARFADMMELRRLNDELAAYDQSVSHDLKNILSFLYTSADWVAEVHESLEVAELQQLLDDICTMAQRGVTVVETLLLLSNPESIVMEPLDMAAIIANAKAELGLGKRPTKTEITAPEQWPAAIGHPGLVQRIWVNFIGNATKYGGDPPRIWLESDDEPDGQIRFQVRDNGPGIDLEAIDRLFLPFSRVTELHVQGHGLGLFIVRRIAESLGGRVGVESKIGEGSTFYFTLPAQ